jgi:hypothetical protein
MRKLKLAIVGCGDIAGFTALVSRLVPQVTLTACCDINVERAGAFAKRHRIAQFFTDYNEMLAKASADAVYLAVPHQPALRDDPVRCEAGKPVFVEKPVTRTLAEAGNSKKGQQAKGRRELPVPLRQRMLCPGRGRSRLGRWEESIPSASIFPGIGTQSYFDGAMPGTNHRAGRRRDAHHAGQSLPGCGIVGAGRGARLGDGIHCHSRFDVEVETLAHGIVETEGGTLISITSSMVAASEQAVTIEVYGEKGTATYRDLPFPLVKFVGVNVRRERPPEWGVHALQTQPGRLCQLGLNDKPFLIPRGNPPRAGGGGWDLSLGAIGQGAVKGRKSKRRLTCNL